MKKIKKFFIILSMLRPVTKLELIRSRMEVAELLTAIKEIEVINRTDVVRLTQKIFNDSKPKEKKHKYEGRSYQ